MKKFFEVKVNKYNDEKDFSVYRPSSLNRPQNNSVMFITEEYIDRWEVLKEVEECVVIWPQNKEIPAVLKERHVIIKHENPRLGYALFYQENGITYNPQLKTYKEIDGAYIVEGAKIGEGTIIFPGAYIDSDVTIGENCYIASGVKLLGSVRIGNDVIIRENTVIGSDGLTRMRDTNGKIVTIPQFGGVTIEDNVQIGALTIIAKGAIDDTIIRTGCRIDNSCFISHNVELGEDSVIVGETIMFGSSSTGKQAFISGNVAVRDGIHIGDNTFVGMGSTVIHPVENGKIVKGSPAK